MSSSPNPFLKIPEHRARTAAWLVIAAALALLPFVFVALRDLKISSGDVDPWMPQGTPEREIYDAFAERFQAHDSLVIGWEGAGPRDPRFDELIDRIRRADEARSVETGEPVLIGSVLGLDSLLDGLGEPFSTHPGLDRALREEVAGYLVSRDGETGVLVVESTAHGANRREVTFRLIDDVVRDILPEGVEPRYAGPCYLAIRANAESRKMLRVVTPVTALLSLLVAFFFLRSAVLAAIAFLVSGLAAAAVISAIHFSGGKLGDMLTVVPSLAQLLAMSNVIHLLHYYAESLHDHGNRRRAWRDAIHLGWLPTTAASVTTMIGFAALFSSNLEVARSFALFGIVGVFLSMVLVLTLTPAILALVLPSSRPVGALQHGFVGGLRRLTLRRRWAVSIPLVLAFGLAAWGLPRLGSDVRMETFFSERSDFHEHNDWFEQKMGSVQGSEVLVEFDPEVDARTQFSYVRSLSRRIGEVDGVGAVFSAAVFGQVLSAMPAGKEWGFFEGTGWVRRGSDGDCWRIAVRHQLDPDPSESAVREALLRAIGESPSDREGGAAEHPRVHLTGGYQLFSTSQDGLVNQLLGTFLCAFLVITPVIVFFLRSIRLGFIAIVGNLFPLVVFFGLLGWSGQRVDIATMMIAAVAFGIAVDDTVHFLIWLSRGMKRERTLEGAISHALGNCAGAILQTTLIISLGMTAFLLSEFQPSVRFALFSALVLVIALVGDLLLLPALILGALRPIFRRRKLRYRASAPRWFWRRGSFLAWTDPGLPLGWNRTVADTLRRAAGAMRRLRMVSILATVFALAVWRFRVRLP